MLTEYGSVVEDFRTNSLVVTDLPSRMDAIAKTIAALDIAAPQVLLEVEMLDVSKNTVDKLGVKFGSTPFSVLLTGAQAGTGFPYGSWSKIFSPATGTIDINNTASGSTYSAQLDFLRTDTETKFLARPKILTLNNEPAEIKITTQETIGVTETQSSGGSLTQSTSTPERVETGVSLRVTPQINMDTGEITMFVIPTVRDTSTSSFVTTSAFGSKNFKDPEERSTKSLIRIKDGDTVVLGGLIRTDKNVTITKLPFFGDLPLIGGLFRHKDMTKDKNRELLVFITPRIIRDSATSSLDLAGAKRANAPEREQDTLSVVKRQSTVNDYLNNFESKKR